MSILRAFVNKKNAFGEVTRDPSQCESCFMDFRDARHPKIKGREFWVRVNTGQPVYVARSSNNDSLCKECSYGR